MISSIIARQKMTKQQELIKTIQGAVPGIRQQMDTRGEVFTERDITLEDVLIALNKKYEEWAFVIALDGHMLIMKRNNENGFAEFEGTGIYWQLNKPLHKQTKETINYLHDLLCQKK